MRKKLLVISLFLVLIASACGAQTPVETVMPTLTETQVATPTGTPTATETPPERASATPIPTNSPNCTNSASFVADVTVPDNSNISPGKTFTKTWRVKNTGSCIWGTDYVLDYYSEERMGAQSSVPLSVTFPDQTVDISVDLTASTAKGSHKGYFVIKNPAGLIMKIDKDSRLWVVINVASEVAAAAGASATPGSGNVPVIGASATPGSGGGNATGSSAGPGFANVTCAFSANSANVTETINALNAYRAQNGLPAYTVNELLTKAATAHANDMACNNLFVHTGSNGSTPASRVAASGYVASSVTENVYGSYPPLTGQGAVDWWKNDKTDINHNLNLLSTKYTEIGVGYSFYNNFGYYVIVFAKP